MIFLDLVSYLEYYYLRADALERINFFLPDETLLRLLSLW